ncbi:uncharacterized protein PADG_06702 [Paracoccidioides brasiliensis Pb18]|uniref:Uncharacterized protein n=1 Tax=Paracoccidioides brasiliensis (strain Pb18) TaxID=502780 RepID=C1GHG6_PARBD|nr:uncharacterized protein PADG_06702 [Paracoccidioides brasiliensis Pb18]EEH50623.2 hypothetical protein PADG_06702 [Paracoccidioides brasiliensis Pb18]
MRQINLFRGWPNPSLQPPPRPNHSHIQPSSPTRSSPPRLSATGPMKAMPPFARRSPAGSPGSTTPPPPPSPVAASRICITGGASQNLACLVQVFSDPLYTRNVWLVVPTYYLACRIFDDAGFSGKLREVSEDAEGVDVEELARGLESSEGRAGAEKGWERERNSESELVLLARKYDALIISDDVYDHLQWPVPSSPSPTKIYPDKALVPRIVDVDRYLDGGPQDDFGNAVSNGSFSKIVGPGCRVGWAEGTDKFVYGLSQTGSSRSGGCSSQLTSTFIRELLSTNSLQTHIRNVLQPEYCSRYFTLTAAVRKHLVPLGVLLTNANGNGNANANTSANANSGTIAGGYFLWLRLPRGLRASDLAGKAQEEEDVVIAAGNLFNVAQEDGYRTDADEVALGGAGDFESYVRFCFAWEEERFEEGG